MGELTRLLEAARNGQSDAVDQVVALTCAPRITVLDTGVLVSECYLRLVKVGELNARPP